MKISLCMIVKNEEHHLERCLKSVEGLVDEIIIVDTGSTDRTIDIARNFNTVIVHHEWKNDFAAARNAGLEIAKGDYILVLDADEELDEKTKYKILEYLKSDAQGYMLLIENYHDGELTSGSVMRLFKNRSEYRFRYPIHEQIEIIYEGETPLILTDILIKHYGYTREEIKRKDKRKRNRDILESMVETKNPYFLYQLAVEYSSVGQHQEAYKLYIEVYSNVDRNRIFYPEVVASFMTNCFYTGHLEQVHQLFNENIKRFGDYTDLYSIDGKTYLKQNIFDKALEQFRSILGRRPNPIYKCTQGIESYKTIADIGQVYELMGEKKLAAQYYQTAFKKKPSSDNFLLLLDFLGDNPEQIQLMFNDLEKYINFYEENNLHVILFRLLLNGQFKSFEDIRKRYNSINVNDKLYSAIITKNIEDVLYELNKYDDTKSQLVYRTVLKFKNRENLDISEFAMIIALRWETNEVILNDVHEGDKLEIVHHIYRFQGMEHAIPLYIKLFAENIWDVLSLQRIGDALLQNDDLEASAQMYYRAYTQKPTSTNIFRLIEFSLRNNDKKMAVLLLHEGLELFKESSLLKEVEKILK